MGFYGHRQAGVATPPPACASFVALDLHRGVGRSDLRRLLRVLTQDAAQLTQGHSPITDQEPEMAEVPARLTITLGFGEKVFDLVDPQAKPDWLKPLPSFEEIDQLDEAWGQADLLLQLCCDDRVTLSHAQRMLLKEARGFADVAWVQEGFRNAAGSLEHDQSMRNLFGQVDGTVNPRTEDRTMDEVVYGAMDGLSAWQPGGTSLVIRRIHMNLDTWDEADRPAREDAVGRTLDTGAPLTGTRENDVPDLSAKNHLGFPVISDYAHVRRATAQAPQERILRRPYNYDLPVQDASGLSGRGQVRGGLSNAGLIFASYQADPVRQFVPIQRRLAELDMLNTWTVPIGSSVFAIPPGCAEDGYLGDFLFGD